MKSNCTFFAVGVVIMACIIGCRPSVMAPGDLEQFVRDEANGLTRSATVDGTQVVVSYRPTDVMVAQQLDERITVGKMDSLRKNYAPYYYFIASFSKDGKEALHQAQAFGSYSNLVQTLSFRMGEYVTLTTADNDTIPVSDFVLERTYGVSTSTDVLFVFDRKKTLEQEWVQFNLNEFGLGLGNQRFRFDTEDLNNAPGVKF